MDINILFTSILGLALIILPIILGARYLGDWRLENRRLERRMRDLE